MAEHLILIEPDGVTRFVWDDDLADVAEQSGRVSIDRASHVEPTSDGQWESRMVDGPVLGPFRLRSEALCAEREWLRQYRGM